MTLVIPGQNVTSIGSHIVVNFKLFARAISERIKTSLFVTVAAAADATVAARTGTESIKCETSVSLKITTNTNPRIAFALKLEINS